jgi:hypothetical protein
MACPHLREAVMLFCDAYVQKKMLPLDRIVTANPCLGDFNGCPMFKAYVTGEAHQHGTGCPARCDLARGDDRQGSG